MPSTTPPPREHFAQPRGFVTMGCPVMRCDFKYRFSETDLTVADAQTEERRIEWLRLHHQAGHPARLVTKDQLHAIILKTLTMGLKDIQIALSKDDREYLTSIIVHAIRAAS